MTMYIQTLAKVNYQAYKRKKNTNILFKIVTIHNKITKLTLTLKLKKKKRVFGFMGVKWDL